LAKADAGLGASLKDVQRQLGVSTEALVLEGENRVTVAIGLAIIPDDETWNYRIEMLNLPALALPLALSALTMRVSLPPAVSDAAAVPAPTPAAQPAADALEPAATPDSTTATTADATTAGATAAGATTAGAQPAYAPAGNPDVVAAPGDIAAPGTAVLPEGQAPAVVDVPVSGTTPAIENAN
jgi:hypothetical protein